MIHICIRHQYTVCPQPRIFFLVHRSYEQYCSNSYVCIPAVELRNGKRQAVTLLLSRRHPRGLSAPVERRGRASTPARPGSAHTFPSGHRARAGPSVTFPFPSAPVRPPPLAFPRPPLFLSHTRTGPPETRSQTAPKEKKTFLFHAFFSFTKEREIIFRGPPAPEPTASPAASRRLRGGPYPPRRRGRREEKEQYKEEGGSGSPGGEEASRSCRRRGRARASASVISAAKVARGRRRGGCASGCRHPP